MAPGVSSIPGFWKKGLWDVAFVDHSKQGPGRAKWLQQNLLSLEHLYMFPGWLSSEGQAVSYRAACFEAWEHLTLSPYQIVPDRASPLSPCNHWSHFLQRNHTIPDSLFFRCSIFRDHSKVHGQEEITGFLNCGREDCGLRDRFKFLLP
jgi:hypothetical protein